MLKVWDTPTLATKVFSDIVSPFSINPPWVDTQSLAVPLEFVKLYGKQKTRYF
jgi:hypothetical protein